MTQGERIIDYMRRFQSITPFQAFADLGITKLATRVSELLREGQPIEKEMVKGKNRFGDNVCYMRYSLRR